ncbi:group I truncated hemoglobin [Sphingomonas abietis]|uniref:Group 1 truncated hemoglobin n=1 Tax=Sphingomonas abietis TaxID=3012344 RepID=A0ABY7NJS4_9SPHN|nr:group 1 truncated hemoglobin [Sphingomonas abietis]WBO21497.1 group 1 truncated hemoglobin [Sphingomonas abietis]
MLPLLFFVTASAVVPSATVPPGEQPVDPYTQSDANAGATAFSGQGMWHSFHEQAGVDRIVDGFVDRNVADPLISDIFKGQDLVRLRRTLKEQFCYILGGGCAYSGRDMKESHKNLGVQAKDMNALVVNLQKAMSAEKVPFAAQMRFLSKLAPMKRDVVTR